MSLKPEPMEPVPEETAQIARAAFPNGNLCLRLRDTLGTIYTDQLFADLFPTRGQPAEARLSTGLGHRVPVCGGPLGSASGRCGPWPN
jgi:hypothetical protein